jgi:hypothetical protein
VKLDDRFPDHPKIAAAGPLAGWLYICGLAYCNRLLTDGFIPRSMVTRLADLDNAHDQAERLVDVGLWELCDGGYRIHDYHDYQPTSEHVESIRQARAIAGSKGGQAKSKQIASELLDACLHSSQAKSKPVPVPVKGEVPVTSVTGTAAPAPRSARPDLRKPKEREKGWLEEHALYPVTEELFGRPARSQWSDRAECVKDLDELGATPDDVRRRAERYPAVMGNAADGTPIVRTLRALVKHWHLCGPVTLAGQNGHAREPDPPPRTPEEGARIRHEFLTRTRAE